MKDGYDPLAILCGVSNFYGMKKRENVEMISTSDFAARMRVNYRTALNWLKSGIVPGAVLKKLPSSNISYWEIPSTAVEMKPPRRGPKVKKVTPKK